MNPKLRAALVQFTRTFPIWVILGGIIAFWAPGPFLIAKGGINIFFAVTMFGIGVALEPADFRRVAVQPGIVAIGTAAQFTLMPLGAFALARLFNLPDGLAIGLILTGCAPGAMASNVMSYIARADTAYSVTLTAVSTLLCPILTPLLVWLLARTRLDVPFLTMAWQLTYMVVLPLLGGFAARHFFRDAILRFLEVFPAISAAFIIYICSMVIALNRERLADLTGIVLLAGVVLNLYGLAGGYAVGALFRMERRRKRTLAIEIGMQNAGLGAVLALNNVSAEAAVPAAIFVFICIIIPSLLAGRWQRSADAEDAVSARG